MEKTFVHLGTIAKHLGLPEPWLREEARRGRIPCLRVGRRTFFYLPAVKEALLTQVGHEPAGELCIA